MDVGRDVIQREEKTMEKLDMDMCMEKPIRKFGKKCFRLGYII
jgi:hypothetical protein